MEGVEGLTRGTAGLIALVFELLVPAGRVAASLLIFLLTLGIALIIHSPRQFWLRFVAYAWKAAVFEFTWVAVGSVVLIVAALLLAWVDFDRLEPRWSKTSIEIFMAGAWLAATIALASAWTFEWSNWQFFVFAYLTFAVTARFYAAGTSALKLYLRRPGRPARQAPPPQEPHGASRKATDEPETI